MPRIVYKSPPAFSPLALAVCAALVATTGYTDFLHLRYLP
jgi:hypothetical protein